jgi:hypothetical protein
MLTQPITRKEEGKKERRKEGEDQSWLHFRPKPTPFWGEACDVNQGIWNLRIRSRRSLNLEAVEERRARRRSCCLLPRTGTSKPAKKEEAGSNEMVSWLEGMSEERHQSGSMILLVSRRRCLWIVAMMYY